MSIPTTPAEIRARFADIRKLVQYSGPPDAQVCQAEEEMVKLAERQRRVPTALVNASGYPSGGSGDGGRSSDRTSSTERAALTEPRLNSRGEPIPDDQVGALFTSALWSLGQMGANAGRVNNVISEAVRLSSLRQSLGRTVAQCCEEGCQAIATTTEQSRFPGRCDADRQWLEHEHRRAEKEGRDPIRAVPREVIERRDNPPKRHEHDTEDDVIDRLLAGYNEGADA